jgi:sensor c-di-GMP phosphodiesterase-like protein
MGCKIAIGNAGRGQKLAHVLQLGVDIIKIDKSLILGLETDDHSKAVVDTLVDLAKNMRMEIIAVGVENITQVTYLRELGVGVAQGHLFAPPLPAPAFLQLLEAMDPLTDTPVGLAANASAASA